MGSRHTCTFGTFSRISMKKSLTLAIEQEPVPSFTFTPVWTIINHLGKRLQNKYAKIMTI